MTEPSLTSRPSSLPSPEEPLRIELGSAVHCTDGPYGELSDVIIDPVRRRVTHLIVQPHHRHDLARLVEIERAHARSSANAEIAVDYTASEISQLEPVQMSAYLRIGDAPVEDPDWEVGIESILALPYYGTLSPDGVGTGGVVGFDEHVAEVYDRVPKDRVEVRRASAVMSADDLHLGHVDGFVVNNAQRITHLVLEHGHLWGKREVTIPINAVATVQTDEVRLSLSEDQVGRLEPVPIKRWAS